MIITTYLANQEAHIRIKELDAQEEIRHLTDEEKSELHELKDAIRIFKDEILLNFE